MMEKWSRVGSYLEKYADDLVFDQFQEGYLKREGIDGFMKDVPVPMSTGDVVDFHTQKGLDVMNVVKNMIRIIGINPQFPYVESYLKYIGTGLHKDMRSFSVLGDHAEYSYHYLMINEKYSLSLCGADEEYTLEYLDVYHFV